MPSPTREALGQLLDRGDRFLVAVAQRQQRVEDVGRRRRRAVDADGVVTSAPSLSFSSSSSRSAVFLPMPGILVSRPASCIVTACASSATDRPDSTDSAVRAPTPLIFTSWRNARRSCSVPKPKSRCASSRTTRCVNSAMRSPVAGQVVERAHRHVDLVRDALHVEQELRRVLLDEDSGEAADHGACNPFGRLSHA